LGALNEEQRELEAVGSFYKGERTGPRVPQLVTPKILPNLDPSAKSALFGVIQNLPPIKRYLRFEIGLARNLDKYT
jgi:hypothetical protein